MSIAKLKNAFNNYKNAVYLQNHVTCPFTVDTSCIRPQMRPWSSCSEFWDVQEIYKKPWATDLMSDLAFDFSFNVKCRKLT